LEPGPCTQFWLQITNFESWPGKLDAFLVAQPMVSKDWSKLKTLTSNSEHQPLPYSFLIHQLTGRRDATKVFDTRKKVEGCSTPTKA